MWTRYKAGATPKLQYNLYKYTEEYLDTPTNTLQPQHTQTFNQIFMRPLISLLCFYGHSEAFLLSAGSLLKQLTMSTSAKHKSMVSMSPSWSSSYLTTQVKGHRLLPNNHVGQGLAASPSSEVCLSAPPHHQEGVFPGTSEETWKIVSAVAKIKNVLQCTAKLETLWKKFKQNASHAFTLILHTTLMIH